jgi:hypothetical protein
MVPVTGSPCRWTGACIQGSGTSVVPASCRVLLGLLFDPEERGVVFLRNVGRLSADYTVLYNRT